MNELKAWWDRYPGRMEWEEQQFRARGLPVNVETNSERGIADFRTELKFHDQRVPIRVQCGPLYPDTPPTVYGPIGLLERHQQPANGNFCLLEDPGGRDWWPGLCAAHLVDEDLRWLLEDTERGPDAVAANEADIPEPRSAFFDYEPTSVLIVPDPLWKEKLNTQAGRTTYASDPKYEMIVIEHAEGFAIDPEPVDVFERASNRGWPGRWAAIEGSLPAYPSTDDLKACVDTEALASASSRGRRRSSSAQRLLALTFMEEGPRRGQQRRSWVGARLIGHGETLEVVGWIRAQAFSADERRKRIPELEGLSGSSVLVVGAGSLGAPVLMEFVKAGIGRAHVIDHDFYDVNNAVRHILPITWAGRPKAEALTAEARRINPFALVQPHSVRIGDVESAKTTSELVKQVDLVVDTTGSPTVARAMTTLSRHFHKPLLVAGLTKDSLGGDVSVGTPDGACWYCFSLHQEDGSVPSPHAGTARPVTPAGCSHPTFTGPGFEATELAAITTRMAIQTLSVTSYPPMDSTSTWTVANFRAPPWLERGTFDFHSDCPLSHQ